MLDLESINVNLLIALDALLAERNVTLAGKKVGIAQSSMSHALSRLRELFDDPLLVRSTEGMVPTPLAEQIEAPLREALKQLRRAVQGPAEFDPGSASNTFTLASDSLQQAILLPRLLEILQERAPGVCLRTLPPARAETCYRLLRAGELDVAIGRFQSPPAGIHHETLSTDRVVYIARKDHPRIKRKITKARLREEVQLVATPVTTGQLSSAFRPAEEGRKQESPKLVMTPHLVASLLVVSQSDVISATVERVAKMYKDVLGLALFAPPIELPTVDTHIAWHERTHHSAAHRWFVELLLELAR